jgi:uncharacterized protein (DUF1330 family)
MSAYVIADVDVHDPEAYARYREGVPATLEAYGGRFVVRGGEWEVLEGDVDLHRLVVIEFADAEAARRWHASPEYRPLRAQREAAATTRMAVVEGAAS